MTELLQSARAAAAAKRFTAKEVVTAVVVGATIDGERHYEHVDLAYSALELIMHKAYAANLDERTKIIRFTIFWNILCILFGRHKARHAAPVFIVGDVIESALGLVAGGVQPVGVHGDKPPPVAGGLGAPVNPVAQVCAPLFYNSSIATSPPITAQRAITAAASTNQPTDQPTNKPTNQPTHPPTRPPAHPWAALAHPPSLPPTHPCAALARRTWALVWSRLCRTRSLRRASCRRSSSCCA